MQFTTLLTVAFASVAAAVPDFAIGVTSISAKDSSQLAAFTKAFVEAEEAWQASVTAKPEWSSAISGLIEYQKTGKDVPKAVTATDKVLTYYTTPDWYAAMPTELKSYFDKNQKEQQELIASVVKKTIGDASQPIAKSIYVSGALAALVGALAIAL